VLLCLATGCREHRAAEQTAPPVPARTASAFPCVHFDELRQLLPEAPQGYAHLRDEGSSGRYGEVSISEAERVFEGQDGQELSVRIVDTTLSGELARAIRAAAKDASGRAQDEATAPIVRDRAVGFVRFDAGAQKAEANVLVADRFVVAVVSHGVDGTLDVRRLAGSIDFDGLALLR
jgi:hypothetical protein